MDTAFKFQAGENLFPLHRKHDLPVAAQLGFIGVHQLHLPAPCGGVQAVHPVQVGRKKRSLLPAGAGPQLHNDAAVIPRVVGQQHQPGFIGQPGDLLLGLGFLLRRHRRKLGITGIEQLLRLRQRRFGSGKGKVLP